MCETFEIQVDACLIAGGIRGRARRVPVERVVRVRRHHRSAVVDQRLLFFGEWSRCELQRRRERPVHRLVADHLATREMHHHGRGARGAEREQRSREHRDQPQFDRHIARAGARAPAVSHRASCLSLLSLHDLPLFASRAVGPLRRHRICGAWRRPDVQPGASAVKRREPSSGLEPLTPSLPWKCSTN